MLKKLTSTTPQDKIHLEISSLLEKIMDTATDKKFVFLPRPAFEVMAIDKLPVKLGATNKDEAIAEALRLFQRGFLCEIVDEIK